MRLRTVGLATGTECEIKIVSRIWETRVGVGRSHASVSMMRLKDEGILDLSRGAIKVLDPKRLFQAGHFNQHYLHLQRES
jgi:hypothetical protein